MIHIKNMELWNWTMWTDRMWTIFNVWI